jgi:hypothetical protein
VATDSVGGVYVTWYDLLTLEVYFTYSHDYGQSWGPAARICGGGNPPIGCSDADVAVDQQNGHVYVMWIDNGTGHTDVYLSRSVDRGVSFGPAVMVNNVEGSDIVSVDNGVSYSAHVAVANDGAVYVAWEDNRTNPSYSDIYLARSTDLGQTFNTNIRVNPYEAAADYRSPWMTFDEAGVLYVAYTKVNSTSQNIFMTKSLDGGLSFNAPAKVNDDSLNCYRGKKEVAVSQDGEINIVWTDARNTGTTKWDIYFATSLDEGLSFGPNVRVNDDVDISYPQNVQGTPSLAIDHEGGIHVVWEDFRNNEVLDWVTPGNVRDVYYAFSKDGRQFSENVKVNYVPGAAIVDCADPNIVIDSNDNLHIVWSDTPYNYSDCGIYYAFSARMLSVRTSKTVVGQGYNLSVNVMILNAGEVDETFNVTVLSNVTVIGTEANFDVSNGTLATLNFTWNTAGLELGNYTISALAGSVSATGPIAVTIPGDIDGNFRVQLQDLVLLAQTYGSKSSDANWNPNADIDGNNVVGLSDLVALAQHYGQHYP